MFTIGRTILFIVYSMLQNLDFQIIKEKFLKDSDDENAKIIDIIMDELELEDMKILLKNILRLGNFKKVNSVEDFHLKIKEIKVFKDYRKFELTKYKYLKDDNQVLQNFEQ